MIRYLICVLCLLFLVSCNNSQHTSSNLDFSGMDEFWKITYSLTNNIEPEEKDWYALFNTPGYTALIESEFPESYFKKYYRLAYMPEQSDSLKAELKKKRWVIKYLRHMTKVIPRKEEIKQHQQELLSTNYLTNQALELTKVYLPEDALEIEDLPPISFVVFGNDARGYSTIVIDILYSIEQGEKLKYLIGHESHHFYRNKKLKFVFPDQSDAEYNLIWVLNQIQAEGIADQIDKRIRFFDNGDMANSKWAQKYKDYLRSTPMLIEKMDSLLVQYVEQPGNLKAISDEIRTSVPMSGHPTGYYMTKVIIENLGKKELISNLGNPFEFFRLYNVVASTHPGMYPMFSEKTIELINNLELKYSKI